jgi:hypothetical protein
MHEYKGSPALDAGLLAAAQAIEHYEMSRYGTLRTWANELGLTKAAALFEKTLKEEKATDDALTKIAESVVNQDAQQAAHSPPNQTSTPRSSSDTMADTARDAVDAVKTKVGDALDRGQAAVSHASDTASEMAGNGDPPGDDVRVGAGGHDKTQPSRHDSRRGCGGRAHRPTCARPDRLVQAPIAVVTTDGRCSFVRF